MDHEIDQLNGITLLHNISRLQRNVALKKIQKSARKTKGIFKGGHAKMLRSFLKTNAKNAVVQAEKNEKAGKKESSRLNKANFLKKKFGQETYEKYVKKHFGKDFFTIKTNRAETIAVKRAATEAALETAGE